MLSIYIVRIEHEVHRHHIIGVAQTYEGAINIAEDLWRGWNSITIVKLCMDATGKVQRTHVEYL